MTLEQLCRASWNADKKGFKKMAEEIRIYQGFVRRFQDEENGEASLEALRRLDAQR